MMDDTERLQQTEAELIQTRLKQLDDHIAALEAKASEPATAIGPAKAPQPAQENEGVTCKYNAPKILTNTPYKKYNDRTIHSNAPSK